MQQIPLVAAPIKASAPFRVADELEFGLLQLEGVPERFWFQLPWVEQELVGGDTEKRLGQFFLPPGWRKSSMFWLANTKRESFFRSRLHKIADILNSGKVREEQVQLIQCSHIVASAQQGIGHVGENGEEQRVPQAAISVP